MTQNKRNGHEARTHREMDAKERQDQRNYLSAQEQLDRLDQRLGKDQGATKERARLEKEINNAQEES